MVTEIRYREYLHASECVFLTENVDFPVAVLSLVDNVPVVINNTDVTCPAGGYSEYEVTLRRYSVAGTTCGRCRSTRPDWRVIGTDHNGVREDKLGGGCSLSDLPVAVTEGIAALER